ncbi:MAG: helix-turn-helix domain-containing protein [Acidaminobacteraceae bacterium]
MKKSQYISMLKKYMEKNKTDDDFDYEVIKTEEAHRYEYGDIDNTYNDTPNLLINGISSYLLEHLKDQEYVSLNSSLQEIAQFFGTSYRNLNRTLKEMESNSIISCKGKKVYILDKEALRELSKN